MCLINLGLKWIITLWLIASAHLHFPHPLLSLASCVGSLPPSPPAPARFSSRARLSPPPALLPPLIASSRGPILTSSARRLPSTPARPPPLSPASSVSVRQGIPPPPDKCLCFRPTTNVASSSRAHLPPPLAAQYSPPPPVPTSAARCSHPTAAYPRRMIPPPLPAPPLPPLPPTVCLYLKHNIETK